MNIKKISYEKLFIFFTVSAVFLLCIQNLGKLNLPYIADDEYGYWSSGAFFAGYDWSNVTQHVGYYSYGYGIILAPIIKMFSDPKLIYKIAIAFNALFVALSFILIYSTGKKLFTGMNKKIIYAVSLLLVLYPSNLFQSNIAWAETTIMFCFWLANFFMVKAIQNRSPLYYVLWEIIVIYMYAVHNRTLPVLIMFFCTIIMLFKGKQINKKQLGIYVIILFAGFIGCSIIKQYLIKHLWLDSKVIAGNTYSGIIKKMFNLTEGLESWKSLFENFAGRVFYLGISTYMLIFISTYSIIINWKRQYLNGKWSTFHYVSIFCFFSLLLETCLSSLMMLNPTSGSINNIIYGRYAEPLVGVSILVGICPWINDIKISKKNFIFYSIISMTEILLGLITHFSIIKRNLNFMGAMNNIGIILFYSNGSIKIGKALIVSIIIGILLVPFFKGKAEKFKKIFAFTIIAILSVVSAVVGSKSIITYHEEHQFMYDVAEIINEQESADIYYLMDGFYSNRKKNILQYILKDKQIKCITHPKKINVPENHFVVTTVGNKHIPRLILSGYQEIGIYEEAAILYMDKNKKEATNSIHLLENLNISDLNLRQGIFATLPEISIDPGRYTLKSKFQINEQNKKYDTEIGFIAYFMDGVEIGRTNIWDNQEGANLNFDFYLDEQEGLFSALAYSYDGIKISIENFELVKKDVLFIDFENIIKGTNTLPNRICSNGTAGIFAELPNIRLTKGKYILECELLTGLQTSDTEIGFIVVNCKGKEVGRCNIICDAEKNIYKIPFNMDDNLQSDIQILLYAYDGYKIELTNMELKQSK